MGEGGKGPLMETGKQDGIGMKIKRCPHMGC